MIPFKDATRIITELKDHLKQNTSESIADIYQRILITKAELSESKEFREEFNHFKCLVNSKVATIFYLKNILLRLGYSSYNKSKKGIIAAPKNIIYKSVIQYFIEYAQFVCLSSGYIEAQHLLVYPKDLELVDSRGSFVDNIKECLTDLTTLVNNKTDSNRMVGLIIDRLYFSNIFPLNCKNQNKELSILESLMLMFSMLKPFIYIPNVWFRAFLVVIKNVKLLYNYLFSRLNSKTKLNVGKLPGILVEDVTIDPTGFPYKKLLMKSQEVNFESQTDKGISDLYWFILSRCGVTFAFLHEMKTDLEIKVYFKKLRKFIEIWSPTSKGSKELLGRIDNFIVTKIASYYSSDNQKSTNCHIGELECLSYEIYRHFIDDKFFRAELSKPNLRAALSRFYMHV